MRAAALLLLASIMFVPSFSEARRVRLSSKRDPGKTLTHWQTRATQPAKTPRCAACTRYGLSIARALFKQAALGAQGKGVFSGKDPATGARKVIHLVLVGEQNNTFTLRTQHIDGPFDGATVTRVFRPVGADGTLVSTDGAARVRLIRGRGFFDYNDTRFDGDPEPAR